MKNKKIKQIDLVFENCESATIYPENIYNFAINDFITQYYKYQDEIHTHRISDMFFIVLKNFSKLEYSDIWFGKDVKKSLKKRLTDHQDITHVDIIYTDKTNDYFGVHWYGTDFRNYHQTLKKLKTRYKKSDDLWVLEITNRWTIGKIFRMILHKLSIIKWRIKKKTTEKIKNHIDKLYNKREDKEWKI